MIFPRRQVKFSDLTAWERKIYFPTFSSKTFARLEFYFPILFRSLGSVIRPSSLMNPKGVRKMTRIDTEWWMITFSRFPWFFHSIHFPTRSSPFTVERKHTCTLWRGSGLCLPISAITKIHLLHTRDDSSMKLPWQIYSLSSTLQVRRMELLLQSYLSNGRTGSSGNKEIEFRWIAHESNLSR